jgi:3'5'-cyclic nucleotide phosphodiesterase
MLSYAHFQRKDRKRGSIRTYWLLTLESERSSRSSGRSSRAPVVAPLDVDDSTTEAFEVLDTPRQNSLLSTSRSSRDTRIAFVGRDRSRERSLSRGRGLDLGRSGSGDQTFQLVQYNSEILVDLLKQVVGSRQSSRRRRVSQTSLENAARNIGNGSIVIEEAVDVISFPQSDLGVSRTNGTSIRKAQLSPEVVDQLFNFVAVIAGLYRPNAFHNIEHATQTTAILTKMLSRVEATRTDDTSVEDSDRGSSSRNLDFAYAIAADPLTKFAMTLAALVHDLDHRGVDNSVLIREEPTLAAAYQGRSVHEQNALELAWNVLLSDGFEELRATIYTDLNELKLFRQVLVNSVIATDIFDPELRALRKDRYKQAFGGTNGFRDSVNDINRKATVAVENLVQASDIGATLQSWSLYTKWNERLYEEAWDAYRAGRTSRNPSLTWYQDEIDFFDKYSIPLAKKLTNCGVFGVAGDEYLNFAEENRRRWIARGREIVALYVETYGRN